MFFAIAVSIARVKLVYDIQMHPLATVAPQVTATDLSGCFKVISNLGGFLAADTCWLVVAGPCALSGTGWNWALAAVACQLCNSNALGWEQAADVVPCLCWIGSNPHCDHCTPLNLTWSKAMALRVWCRCRCRGPMRPASNTPTTCWQHAAGNTTLAALAPCLS